MTEEEQKTIIWSFPTRILYGIGSSARLADEAKALRAARALLITDPGVRSAGLIDPLTESLEQEGISSDVFDGCFVKST